MARLSNIHDIANAGGVRLWLGLYRDRFCVLGLQKRQYYVFTSFPLGVAQLVDALLRKKKECEIATGLQHRLILKTLSDQLIIKVVGLYSYQFYISLNPLTALSIRKGLQSMLEECQKHSIEPHSVLQLHKTASHNDAMTYAVGTSKAGSISTFFDGGSLSFTCRSWSAPFRSLTKPGGPRTRPINQGALLRL